MTVIADHLFVKRIIIAIHGMREQSSEMKTRLSSLIAVIARTDQLDITKNVHDKYAIHRYDAYTCVIMCRYPCVLFYDCYRKNIPK